MRKRGFISHIGEESEIAEYIKDWIKDAFLGQLELFVSSSDMRAGDWLEQIKLALQGTSFVFPLLSLASKDRPWINFESGSAFIVNDIQLIPLCHQGLQPSDLKSPFSHFQAYDLMNPESVTALIQHLSEELDLDMPKIAPEAFSIRIGKLNGLLQEFYTSLEELQHAPELAHLQMDTLRPVEISVPRIDIWDELELRTRIYELRTIELSGYTREAMGFNLYDIDVPEGRSHILVELENTGASIAHNRGQMLKLTIDRQTVSSAIRKHIHFSDSQFTVKGDGWFAFELPALAKRTGKIEVLSVTFWRIELHGLLMRLFLA